MSICFSSNTLANLTAGGVMGWPGGLGLHRLRFSVQYQCPERTEIFVARNFRAAVSVSLRNAPGLRLGTAWPETALAIRSRTVSHNNAVLFDQDISPEQLACIEGLRLGGDLAFVLCVHCEVSNGIEYESAKDELRFPVNRSAWIECMKQFGSDRTVLLEVDLPTNGQGKLEPAVSLLRKAREELDAGNHSGVVQQCRLAIESVQKALDLKPSVRAAVGAFAHGDRKAMTKRDRGLLVSEVALHYAHLAHHVEEDGASIDYGRRDAAFMLALASAVVSNAAAEMV